MRFKLIIFSFFICKALSACPECNIHNYLYGSVYNSKTIYKGKVIESIDLYEAMIQVTDVLRKNDKDTIEIGDIKKVVLYNSISKINENYIFCNPKIMGVKFEVLDERLDWEVRFLMDTNFKVRNVSQAIRLLNGISIKSNYEGRKYIEEHYLECFDSLSENITLLRKECEKNREYFYGDYRLGNLVEAILIQQEKQTIDFLMREIDSIVKFEHFDSDLDSLNYNGKTPVGHYLYSILVTTKNNQKNYSLFTDKYFEIIENDSNNVIQFFSYSLAYDNLDRINKIKFLNQKQKENIVWGVLNTALWNKYYFQRDKIKPLLKVLKKLNEDKEIAKFIDKKFDKF